MALDLKNQYESSRLGVSLRCAIQASGKLCFTEKTIKAIRFTDESAFAIFPDSESKEILYLKLTTKTADPEAFAVKKSSNYWYMHTKTLFNSLQIPYKEKRIIFDMERALDIEQQMGGEWYKLLMRTIEHDEDIDE